MKKIFLSKQCSAALWLRWLSPILISALVAGCAGTSHPKSRPPSLEETFSLPPFLTGPVAVLLTNANDFSARMVIDLPSFSAKEKTINGSLLVQGSHLMFVPAKGDRTFIWDPTQTSGYILSEALQGCAPINSAVHITNIIEGTVPVGSVLQSINGRPCKRTETVVTSSDGTTARFAVWRTADMNKFPTKIESMSGVAPITIDFFDHRREALAQKLFLPPDDFTKYAGSETMRDELAMREKAAQKKPVDEGVSGIGHAEMPSQLGR